MANIHRWIDGKLVEVGSPEELADRHKDDRVIVDPSLEDERRRLEKRDNYINRVWTDLNDSISVSEKKTAQYQKLITDYSTFDAYLRSKQVNTPHTGLTVEWSTPHGPTEEDWRETVAELQVGVTQGIEWTETLKAAKQAFVESVPAEGTDRLSSAILVLAHKHEYLLQAHAARLQNLAAIYERLNSDMQNDALRQNYGMKYAEYMEEEVELKRLSKAKGFLSKKLADQQYLFNT